MMRRELTIGMVLILFGAGFVMGPAVPAIATEAPAGTVLLPQHVDFTQDEITDNWVQDRTEPTGGLGSVSFDGRDDVFRYGLDGDLADESSFWAFEGMRRIADHGNYVETSLYVDPAWEHTAANAGLWVAGYDADDTRSEGWGILDVSSAGEDENGVFESDPRWRYWDSNAGWVELDTTVTFGQWVTIRIALDVEDQSYQYIIDGDLAATVELPHEDVIWMDESLYLGEVFVNSFNFGNMDTAPGFSNDGYDVHWHELDFEFEFDSVRDALAAASDGDTVLIGPGNYDEGSSFWRIDKSVTLRGAGSEHTTIDRSAAESYGLVVDTDDVTLEGFTFIGSQTGPVEFGLKIHFLDNLHLKDVTVRDSGRTGVDLNTVTNVLLEDVSAFDNGGAGIALRNAQGVDVVGAHTSGNAWGGLALWAVGSEELSDVDVTGSSFSGELVGVFAQHQGTFDDIVLAGNTFSDNEFQVLDQTGLDVLDLGVILAHNGLDRAVTVRDAPDGTFIDPTIFSTIPDGVDAATDGDTVQAEAGDYPFSSMYALQKAVTLVGPNHANDPTDSGARVDEAVITSADPNDPLSRTLRVRTDDPGVTIAGFKFETGGTAIWVNGADHVKDLAIENNVFTGNVEAFGTSAAAPSQPNQLDGLRFSNNLVEDNAVRTFSHYTGVRGTGFELTGNEIRDSPGIYLGFVDGANVSGNKISTGSSGVFLADDIANVVISGNNLSGDAAGAGVYVWQKTNFLGPVDVTDNAFSGLQTGISINEEAELTTDVSNWTVRYNQFQGNGAGVQNGGTGLLDARFNWWGDVTGPLVLGDSAGPLGGVKVVPWCLSADCSLMRDLEEPLETLTNPLPVSDPTPEALPQIGKVL